MKMRVSDVPNDMSKNAKNTNLIGIYKDVRGYNNFTVKTVNSIFDINCQPLGLSVAFKGRMVTGFFMFTTYDGRTTNAK